MPESSEAQQDKTRAGQRRINMIWEFTQGFIAILITVSKIYCSIKSIQSPELTNAFFLIVSMYFVRTNHHLIGGTGHKELTEQR